MKNDECRMRNAEWNPQNPHSHFPIRNSQFLIRNSKS